MCKHHCNCFVTELSVVLQQSAHCTKLNTVGLNAYAVRTCCQLLSSCINHGWQAAVELEQLGLAGSGGGSHGALDGSKNKQFEQIEAPPVDRPKLYPADGDECSNEVRNWRRSSTSVLRLACTAVLRRAPSRLHQKIL